MTALHKPSWLPQWFRKGEREGIKLIERPNDWHLHPNAGRTIRTWGPYKTKTARGHKKFNRANSACGAFVQKLEAAWPCTFLVKGYPYRVSEVDDANHKDKVASVKATD